MFKKLLVFVLFFAPLSAFSAVNKYECFIDGKDEPKQVQLRENETDSPSVYMTVEEYEVTNNAVCTEVFDEE